MSGQTDITVPVLKMRKMGLEWVTGNQRTFIIKEMWGFLIQSLHLPTETPRT